MTILPFNRENKICALIRIITRQWNLRYLQLFTSDLGRRLSVSIHIYIYISERERKGSSKPMQRHWRPPLSLLGAFICTGSETSYALLWRIPINHNAISSVYRQIHCADWRNAKEDYTTFERHERDLLRKKQAFYLHKFLFEDKKKGRDLLH